MIVQKDCRIRTVYQVNARNFKVAVYAGSGHFIGIRLKFGHRFLDEENHYETGAPFGTVKPEVEMGRIEDGVELEVRLPGTLCDSCGAPVVWTGPPSPAPWKHVAESTCLFVRPVARENTALLQVLERWTNEGSGSEVL